MRPQTIDWALVPVTTRPTVLGPLQGGDALVMSGTVERGSFQLEADLSAAPGEVLGVLGPNGAGKTTLLRALSGLDALSSGSIRLGDLTLDDAATDTFVPAERRPVGLVFQNYRLFPHLDVRDNVAYAPRVRGPAAGWPVSRPGRGWNVRP